MVNRCLVLLEFLENLNSHSVLKFEGKIKIIVVTYFENILIIFKKFFINETVQLF